jgi:hypothetical protein
MLAVLTPEATGRKGLAISRASTASVNAKSAMAAALAGLTAYAIRNIVIANSGKISIGEEFRAELRETYTESQIERGIERAPSQVGGSTDPVKLLAQIRRCCSYAKQDDEKFAGTEGPIDQKDLQAMRTAGEILSTQGITISVRASGRCKTTRGVRRGASTSATPA